MALSMLAALAWTGAWWNDRTRARAERIAAARMEHSDAGSRPNRLARELPASAAGEESIAP
jgi:hypothetical protein